MRIENIQIRENKNAGNQNTDLKDGSHGTDYMRFLKDGRADWQRVWETEIGTTVQNETETVTRHYIVDYLSIANRDIMVTEDGSFTTRYVYDENGTRISAEFDYAEGTHRGEAGENLQSDIAVSIGKVFYRTPSSAAPSSPWTKTETSSPMQSMIRGVIQSPKHIPIAITAALKTLTTSQGISTT